MYCQERTVVRVSEAYARVKGESKGGGMLIEMVHIVLEHAY